MGRLCWLPDRDSGLGIGAPGVAARSALPARDCLERRRTDARGSGERTQDTCDSRTGRWAGRESRSGPLGISASYGVPAAAVERAVESGMTYVYWGSIRTAAFAEALRHLAPARDRFMLAVQSYARARPGAHLERRARAQADRVRPRRRAAPWFLEPRHEPAHPRRRARLQRRGLVNFVAVSSHNRALAATLSASGDFDIVHLRYNAAHPGAERDCFPHLPAEDRPGMVSFTGTSWGQLLDPRSTRRPASARPRRATATASCSLIRTSTSARQGRHRPITSSRPSRRANWARCPKRSWPGCGASASEVRRRAWLKQ